VISSANGPRVLIRADITFLRQDFSAQGPTLQAAAAAGASPARPRFDFLVRTRPATKPERSQLRTSPSPDTDYYPQRQAVLFALRELTGRDEGPTTEAWQALFPQAAADATAARLSRDVVRANSAAQEVMLVRLRDSKGLANTLALASAIPGLRGDMQEKAREFLTDRLTRMTAETLRDKLTDEDAEVRRAAVVACTRKGNKSLVPDLIAMLDGDEPLTARLAESGLKELTGQDFGAAAEWRAWWEREGRRGSPKAE
jgi:hypothetical protein